MKTHELFFIVLMLLFFGRASAAGDEHHDNHIGAIVGTLTEQGSDGTGESGGVLGVVYERRLAPRWSLGVSWEKEAFSDRTRRQTVIVASGMYNLTDSWLAIAGAGLEGRRIGEGDHYLVRLGTAYHIGLGNGVVLAPEFVVDFVEGGTQVYALSLVLAYGF